MCPMSDELQGAEMDKSKVRYLLSAWLAQSFDIPGNIAFLVQHAGCTTSYRNLHGENMLWHSASLMSMLAIFFSHDRIII